MLAGDGNIFVFAGTLSGNQAQLGGALYAIAGDITVNGGSIAGNTATEAGGGAYAESGKVNDNSGGIFGNTPDDVIPQANEE